MGRWTPTANIPCFSPTAISKISAIQSEATADPLNCIFHATCARVKSRYMGNGHPTFNRESLYWIYKPYYWVYDHTLLIIWKQSEFRPQHTWPRDLIWKNDERLSGTNFLEPNLLSSLPHFPPAVLPWTSPRLGSSAPWQWHGPAILISLWARSGRDRKSKPKEILRMGVKALDWLW